MTTYTIRVFDVLRASHDFLTVTEICQRSGLLDDTVRNALQALRQRKALITVRRQDRHWRYGLLPRAERPTDTRGKRHQATANN